jgi:hypothetical protein
MDANSTLDMQTVIADFLELGHVENIVAMFRQDPACLGLTGALLQDERFRVRLGVAVLFEELLALASGPDLDGAVPSLQGLAGHGAPYVRGDAAHILALIGTPTALAALAGFRGDPDPQVASIVAEVLE